MTKETPAWGGGNYFQLPAEVIKIFGATADFEIEGDKLLSRAGSIGILYTYLNEDDSRYSPHFVDAFACRLAYDISFDLTNQSSKQENLLKLYHGHYLPIAKSANAKERTPQTKMQPTVIHTNAEILENSAEMLGIVKGRVPML